jgi:hypothetical protein
MNNPNEGARILCCRCGARPFPKLSLPIIVRQDFSLMKLAKLRVEAEHEGEGKPEGKRAPRWRPAAPNEGEWFCSQHYTKTATRYRVEEDDR